MKSVTPSPLKGKLAAPPSKSAMQRALAAALLAEGTSTICNPAYCDDTQAALAIIRGLGAKVELDEQQVVVRGGFKPRDEELNCGEAGLSLRMFAPIAALWGRPLTFHAQGSLAGRPVRMLEAPLTQLGVQCVTTNGLAPVTVRGPLRGGNVEVDGSVSSQLLTGLLMALPLVKPDSELQVKALKSKPYVQLTIDLLAEFGVKITHDDFTSFRIPGGQTYRAREYQVAGDWSGAAFLLVAGALAGEVELTGIAYPTVQADGRIIEVLKASGARVSCREELVSVTADQRRSFNFDATECPDLFPPLVALACNCEGRTVISGVSRLRHKESDRGRVLQVEFGKLGAEIELVDDEMVIQGSGLHGGTVDPRGDHRIAMAAATAALVAEAPVSILDASCVNKSYPAFFSDLATLGGIIRE